MIERNINIKIARYLKWNVKTNIPIKYSEFTGIKLDENYIELSCDVGTIVLRKNEKDNIYYQSLI